MRLERFKNQKFSYPGEGDTPSPGPHPPQPRPCGPRRVSSALRASLKVAAATCPPKFQVPSHFFILRRPDIYKYMYIYIIYIIYYIYILLHIIYIIYIFIGPADKCSRTVFKISRTILKIICPGSRAISGFFPAC